FSDGVHGQVDLAHLVGRGVFVAWEEPGFFEQVHIGAESQSVTWPGELDLDSLVLYQAITGQAVRVA
nr:DUF2442 domain-containing protein [Phycisphaerales bacterium]